MIKIAQYGFENSVLIIAINFAPQQTTSIALGSSLAPDLETRWSWLFLSSDACLIHFEPGPSWLWKSKFVQPEVRCKVLVVQTVDYLFNHSIVIWQ